jgi:hypothetical protein
MTNFSKLAATARATDTLPPAACRVVSETSDFGRNSVSSPLHHRFVTLHGMGGSARRRGVIRQFGMTPLADRTESRRCAYDVCERSA